MHDNTDTKEKNWGRGGDNVNVGKMTNHIANASLVKHLFSLGKRIHFRLGLNNAGSYSSIPADAWSLAGRPQTPPDAEELNSPDRS